MKKLMIGLITVTLSISAHAVTLSAEDLIVTKVSIETPLPTGLENAEQEDKPNELWAALRKDDRISGFVSAAEGKYLEKNNHGNAASVQVDCKMNPAPYGMRDNSMCKFTAVKNYGWYADLALILTVEGYLKANIAKKFQ